MVYEKGTFLHNWTFSGQNAFFDDGLGKRPYLNIFNSSAVQDG